MTKQILALPPSDGTLNGPTVISTFCLNPDMRKKIEPVGKFYAQLQNRVANWASFDLEEEKASEKRAAEEDDVAAEANEHNEDFEKKRKKKSKEDIEREALLMGDLYATLGIEGTYNYEATEAQIGKAYKRAALHFHPDKLGANVTEKSKEVWLKIDTAYKTLSDPAKRKKYDSSLPFDDKIVQKSEVTSDAAFYDLFEKCFTHNARFSSVKPFPYIGNANTPMEDVKKFYKFWDNFVTWREFSQYDEYDTIEAQDRYERRYMENENKKKRAKYVKAERARILRLVETAYNNDPRIQKELKEIEAAK